jgi:4-hydroxy 2-oxovalerate aldolase
VADSFGGLLPRDLPQIIETLRGSFGGPVGCHLHDNMTYALSSTLAAVDAGATWVDGTLLGMGRGPGNVRTEYLVLELARAGRSSIDIVPLIDLVTGEMSELQRKYGWGSSLYYFMSALYGIHPTYIMELTKDGRYGAEEIVSALESLRTTGAQFGREQLAAAMSGGSRSYAGTASLSGWCSGETVLIVGPGPSALDKRDDIERYIEAAKPVVIGLNAHSVIRPELVGAVAACHPTRIAMDAAALSKLDKPLFAPREMLDQAGVTPAFLHDLGIETSEEGFSFGEGMVRVPEMLVAAYALAVAALGGASRILIVGFDGYGDEDPRQAEMVSVFDAFRRLPDAPPVLALTRTTYPIPQSSIHADF